MAKCHQEKFKNLRATIVVLLAVRRLFVYSLKHQKVTRITKICVFKGSNNSSVYVIPLCSSENPGLGFLVLSHKKMFINGKHSTF